MSNSYEPYPIPSELLKAWLNQSIIYCMGYVKVENYGGCYALVEKGIYTVFKNGHSELRHTSRQRQLEIFTKLIRRYHNFERNGYGYHWHNGSWRRIKRNTVQNR